MDTFVNSETLVPEKVDLEGINKVYDDWRSSFVNQFKGVPVRIDENLEGGQYYIAVSREIYEDLKVKEPHPAPTVVPERP